MFKTSKVAYEQFKNPKLRNLTEFIANLT